MAVQQEHFLCIGLCWCGAVRWRRFFTWFAVHRRQSSGWSSPRQPFAKRSDSNARARHRTRSALAMFCRIGL